MSPPAHPVPATHQDETGLQYGRIVAAGVGTLCVFALAILWSTHIMNSAVQEMQPHGAPPVPALVDTPEIGIVNQRMFELDNRAEEKKAAQRKRLTTYGWVDRQKQVARIPVERAVELLLAGQGQRK